MMLINLVNRDVSGRVVADKLEEKGITVNKNSVPADPLGPNETSGIRIGTAAETTRGKTAEWFADTANVIADVIEECEIENC